MSFLQIREQADRVRAIPLEAVLELTEAKRDRSDRARWHTSQGVLSVNGPKFMNWSRGVGGGGAIDLVMHLENLDFKATVEWLSRRFPSAASAGSLPAPSQQRSLELPPRDQAKLPLVTRYLVGERCLPAPVIDPLIEAGSIYADRRANAVFLLRREDGRPVGAELRGTTRRPWRGMAPGSKKDLGYFSVRPPQTAGVVLCESAIDALSCFALHPSFLCLSTAGVRPNPRWLDALLQDGQEVACGFDADPAGDAAARAMIALHPSVTRLRPSLKDWNDVLVTRP